jgi:hypothetical protein
VVLRARQIRQPEQTVRSMELGNISIDQAKTPGRVRLSAMVSYDDGLVPPEQYWYEVDQSLADSLSHSGNPWLALLLPLAVTLGEPLRLAGAPLDPVLLENARKLMCIWKLWYPWLSIVPLDTDNLSPSQMSAFPSKTAAFFSGGVDSYFTALQHQAKALEIDELLYVWGFEIPLNDRESFDSMKASLERSARYFHRPLLCVTSNLKETRLRTAKWAQLSHGAALASVGLALEKRFANVMIPSTLSYANAIPWGSHPLTDPLCSTGRTHVLHDGAEWNRAHKTEQLGQHQELLDSLRVCAVSFTEKNCGACNKCYRTMITLEILGLLERCKSFPVKQIDLSMIERIYSDHKIAAVFLEEVRALALERGRKDIARGIERSFTRSARLRRILKIVESLKGRRFIWKYAEPVERVLLWRSIC